MGSSRLLPAVMTALVLAVAVGAEVWAADLSGRWAVSDGELIYEVSHVLHGAQGRSTDAQGTLDCEAERCTFRFAAPLRSFASGDADRDRDMLQVTHAGRHPEVVVEGTGRLVTDDEAVVEGTVRLAGGEATLEPARFQVERGWWRLSVRGQLTVHLSALGIERPALLSVPISDTVRVYVRLNFRSR